MSGKSRYLAAVAIVALGVSLTGLIVFTNVGRTSRTRAAGVVSPLPSVIAQQKVIPSDAAAPPVTTPEPEPVPNLSPKEAVAAAPKAEAAAAPASKGGCLKGVGTWDLAQGQKALKASGSCWFYTWSPKNWFGSPAGVQFVPMIWSGKDMGEIGNVQGPTLLGFNEPDLAGQANMSVEDALNLWPRLMSTGKRLGSPAPAWGGDIAGGWLDRFMQGAADRKYRVDFIALHWYGAAFDTGPAVNDLRSYLARVYAKWHKPIWLTEFALIDHNNGMHYPPEWQTTAFVKAATAMLDGLPYVERYAYFALPATRGNGTGLYNDQGDPTDAGRAFEAARRTR
jgi:hypothetical protein